MKIRTKPGTMTPQQRAAHHLELGLNALLDMELSRDVRIEFKSVLRDLKVWAETHNGGE